MKNQKKRMEAARGLRPAELLFRGGQIVNVYSGEIYPADVAVTDGVIVGVGSGYTAETVMDVSGKTLIPGLIDAHLHLESTMVTPSELVEVAVKRGTTTYIVDPHEAANVRGAEGIQYILDETEDVPANVYVMMPSCVPALPTEDNGADFGADEMKPFLSHPRVLGLGEVMDYVSVNAAEPSMQAKLDLFDGKPRDGHAPGLSGTELQAYVLSGVDSDHEASTAEELLEKHRLGMHILVREGSAARNLDTLVGGIVEHGLDTHAFSFCTDDKHIEDIRAEGHIDYCVRRAIAGGIPAVQAVQMATINTARQYGLSRLGAIAPGRQADLLVLDDLETVQIAAVYHAGQLVVDFHAKPKLDANSPLRHTVNCRPVTGGQLRYPVHPTDPVITLIPGQLATIREDVSLPQKDGLFVPNAVYSKIACVERHRATGKVGVGAVKGFGIQNGAVASTVGHDSHNLIVIGDNDDDMLCAIERLRQCGGGYTVVSGGTVLDTVELPILGLMSDAGFDTVQQTLQRMIQSVHALGVPEDLSPFILLSFLALPVIPELRITPRGLFDVTKMSFVE
ncbi:MAG: adenine deaminase [Butyricicoccus sp.]